MAKLYIVPTRSGTSTISRCGRSMCCARWISSSPRIRVLRRSCSDTSVSRKTPFAPQVQRTRHGQDGGRVDCRRTQCRAGLGRRDARDLRSGVSAGQDVCRGRHRGRDAPRCHGAGSRSCAERIPVRPVLFRGVSAPEKGRAKQLQSLADEERTMVFYESPYRVVKCLEQFAEVFGSERRVSVSRELTKKFEQTVRGTVAEVLEHFRTTEPKGEFVIVLAGKPKPKRELPDEETE